MSTFNITSEDIDAAFEQAVATLGDYDFNDKVIKAFIQEIQYQGLNPAKIAQMIMKKGQGRDLKMDILKMVILGIERGNRITNMIKKSTDDGAQVITELKNHYGLLDRPNNNVNTITLSRVALAFPFVACEYAAQALSRTVPKSSLPPNFPLHMTHSAFANLIPIENDSIMDKLSTILLYYQVLFSKVIDKDAKKKSNKQIIDKAQPFIEAGMNSQYISHTRRVEYLIKWGILVDGNSLNIKVEGVHREVAILMDALIDQDRYQGK